MNKLANMRHWPERMSPNFGMSRSNMGMPVGNPHAKVTPQGAPPVSAAHVSDGPIHYAFNVPFASELAGPDTEDILYASPDGVMRWTHPEDVPDDVPVHELPVHAQNLANLRAFCTDITQRPTLAIEATVICETPSKLQGMVTTVCLSGTADLVYKTREKILNDTPLSLVNHPPRPVVSFAS